MEAWRDISGFEGRYQVSDQGRVRSLDRYIGTKSKTGTQAYRLLRGRVLKPQRHTNGYRQVTLCGRTYLIHILVMRVFEGDCPYGHEVAHRDGDRTNNTFLNLRYATPLSNTEDKRAHGTFPIGETVHNAKLSAADVLRIRASNRPQADLAAEFGVQQSAISRIKNRKRWAHV
jgi:hypothetical protein